MRAIGKIGLVLFLATVFTNPSFAVETSTNDYITTAPTGTNVPNWETGWAQPVGEAEGSYVTGWNYVGQINGTSGNSATYLGNGWVLTAAHVGSGTFTLNGETYGMVPNSAHDFYANGAQVDLCLFLINTTSLDNSTTLNLPPLTIGTSDPIAFAYGTPGSSVVMIGYGTPSPLAESWGFNTVNAINYTANIGWISNDFLTYTGTTTYPNPHGWGSQSVTNNAQLIVGDSGGGDFIYNATTGQWELAGINEINGTLDDGQIVAGFIQLDTYAAQINAIINPPCGTDSPTLPPLGLVVMACLLIWIASRSLIGKSNT